MRVLMKAILHGCISEMRVVRKTARSEAIAYHYVAPVHWTFLKGLLHRQWEAVHSRLHRQLVQQPQHASRQERKQRVHASCRSTTHEHPAASHAIACGVTSKESLSISILFVASLGTSSTRHHPEFLADVFIVFTVSHQ